MAENSRPPVAIRIVRPYESEDELLEHELETIGKTSVVLIGAHPRPTGVILRFEVTLASGTTVLRGEGRVLAHKDNAFRGQPGLTLRFTRLDPRSKAVVDRATAMREARSQGDIGSPSRPPPGRQAIPQEGALADALTASTPAPAPISESPPVPPAPHTAPLLPSTSEQESAVSSARASAREKANATARANAKRTRPASLTPPPPPEVLESASDEEDRATDGDRATPAPTPVTSVPGEVAERELSAQAKAPPATAPTISAPPLRGVKSRPVAVEHVVVHDPDPDGTDKTIAPSAPSAPSAPAPAPTNAPRPTNATSATSAGALEPPPDRADLLGRLRERAAKLAPDRVEEILSSGQTSRAAPT